MDETSTLKSRARVALSIFFFTGFFVWSLYFYSYISLTYPHAIPDKLVVWGGLIVASSFLLVGFIVLLKDKPTKSKDVVIGFVFFFVWSLGLMAIPVPEGYGEGVLGIYFLFLIAALVLYSKLRESRKKTNQRSVIDQRG